MSLKLLIEELEVGSSFIVLVPPQQTFSLRKSLVSLSGSPEGIEKRTLMSL